MSAAHQPAIDIVDSTWFAARPAAVAAVIAEPANWGRWWPGLELRVDELRGDVGVRWFVVSVAAGRVYGLAGTAEVWLESTCGGVVAHFIARLDPLPGRTVPLRLVERITDDYRLRTKQAFWALADRLDPGRMTRHTSTSHATLP